MFISLIHGIGIIATDGMIRGTILGMDGMLHIIAMAYIAGMIGDGITVQHGISVGAVTYIILHITIMVA